MAATAFGPVGAKRAAEGDAAAPVEGAAKPTKKQLRFRAVSLSSLRLCLKIESLAAPAAWRESDGDNYPPKGRKPLRGAKESFLGAKDGPRVERNQRRAEANQFHRRAIPARIGEIRMRIRMRFCLRRAEEASMPTGSRVKALFRWLPYAAVCAICGSLKREKAEKTPTPKRGA